MRATTFARPKRRSARLAIGLVMAAVAALSAWAAFIGNATTASADGTVIVNISATAPEVFAPKNTSIDVGTTVRFVANGPLPHTVTSDGCVDPAAGACTFDTGDQFSSVLQSTGAKPFYEFKFTSPGVYPFFCRIHGAPGGVGHSGTITVQAPSGVTGAPPVSALILRPSASVAIYEPRDGATVTGDKVTVNLGVGGAQLRAPAGLSLSRNFGHFNLMLDVTNPDLSGNQIAPGPTTTRATTNTVTLENVRPGPHTLTAVWVYDNNVPPQPPITYTVKFTTVAGGPAPDAAAAPAGGAPALRPPATGDAGLAGSHGGSSTSLYLASAVLLIAAAGVGYRMRDRA